MEDIETATQLWIRKELSAPPADENLFETIMDYFASLVTREALNLTNGNHTQAAKLLGLSRPTLLAKIDKYGLKIQTAVK